MAKKLTNIKKNKSKYSDAEYSSPLQDMWQYFYKSKGAVIGLFIIICIIIIAICAPLLTFYTPIETNVADRLMPPFWVEGGQMSHILGTDDLGRDLFSRLVYGARYSLFIGCIVVTLSLSVGVFFGLLAGYVRGPVETVIMRITDIMLAIPSLLLAIVIVAILGPSLINAMFAVSISFMPHYIRLVRATAISESVKDYVMASKVAGAGTLRQMYINILPNCMPVLIVQATLSFSNAILDAAALGFLGLGAKPPTPEWGTILSDAKEYIFSGQAWWFVTFPGVCILVTVLSFNLLGDGLRDVLDPKLKK